jgi:hypothetical protein
MLVDLAVTVGDDKVSMLADSYQVAHTSAFAVPLLDLRVRPADPSESPIQA